MAWFITYSIAHRFCNPPRTFEGAVSELHPALWLADYRTKNPDDDAVIHYTMELPPEVAHAVRQHPSYFQGRYQ